MEIEQARDILELDIEHEYENCFAEGIIILYRYVKGKFNYTLAHEQLWFGNFEETVQQMTELEVHKLAKYGWFEDEESWSLYS